MNLKSIFPVIFIGFSFSVAFAQDKATCERIVAETVDAINKQSFEQIEQHFAPNFNCAGQQGKIAMMVLKQLSKQALDVVLYYSQTGETMENDELTMIYDISTDKLGVKETTFVFNSNNQLKRLDFSGVQVKTMNKETKVEKLENNIITVPVQISKNNMIIAEAKINGITKKFIVDNGAPALILNSKYTNVEKQDSVSQSVISTSKDVNGSVSGLDIVKISEFDFYGMNIKNQDILTKDLSGLEQSSEMEIAGLIGFQVFKDYDVLFDYKNRTLVFLQPDFTSNYLKNMYKHGKIVEIPIEMQQHIPCVKATIGKQEFSFGIDCGAGGNLLNENFYSALKKQLKNIENTDLKGVGEAKNVQSGRLKEMRIGNKTFKKTLTVFNDMNHLNVLKIDGLVGYEILSKQKTLLSFKNKTLIFVD